jgi:hypothetical protein
VDTKPSVSQPRASGGLTEPARLRPDPARGAAAATHESWDLVPRFRSALSASASAGKVADVRVHPGAGPEFRIHERPSCRAEQAADA